MPIRQRFEYQGVEGARVGRLNRGINTTFVVYRLGETVIDTGPSNQWSSVRRFLDSRPPRQLLLTHHHEDHSGNAARIAQRFGLTPLAPELGRAKLASGYRTPPIQRFIWGRPYPVQTEPLPERIRLISGDTLTAVATPGHAKDLTCFHWPERGWLFSGDLYISKSLRYLRADEELQLLMHSIHKVLQLEFEVVFCPHRGVVEQGHQALSEKLENLKQLCHQARHLRQQGLDEQEMVRRLLGPEDWLAKVSFYNISKGNLVRQAARVSLGGLGG
ncbi:MBL fold metallo-hydrolase [Ferrimonas kyonanensis]|uniref:MBL fold metallo-hydrolase n=1 Tax=Ferrimonas kyonanensis TaxID=364763 RepID=UPI0004182C2F|nr:MBL fold metallo-hydrolase [Ferrimonas kyonanensis]